MRSYRVPALAICGALCVCLLGPRSAGAEGPEIVGRPRAVDGDTLDFAGRLVHLFGIDAPEVDQTCAPAGRTWPCGMEARWALLNRVSPHWVTCVETAREADGAVRAVCYLAGRGQFDLNAWLVAEGWALADRAVSDAYVAEEAAAQTGRKGLWRGSFEAPWDWRRRQGSRP